MCVIPACMILRFYVGDFFNITYSQVKGYEPQIMEILELSSLYIIFLRTNPAKDL